MLTPFLRLVYCKSWGPRNLKVVLGASGPSLYCFNANDGSFISRWTHVAPPSMNHAPADSAAEPPAKRRRLSAGDDDEASDNTPDIITINEAGEKPRRRKRKIALTPSIFKLCVTTNGQHVIAVTAEDKTVRVLEMLDGNLTQVSERKMTKRPNAITLSPDETAIVVADKFGDVFSLPLIATYRKQETNTDSAVLSGGEDDWIKPAATTLTVHTKKNLQALENQLKSRRKAGPKKELDFDHALLLGHVSLLTDLIYTASKVEGQERHFLITADRDEHIRISRGPPQTFVTEGFCMGHTSFVNRLLILPSMPDVLVSGGGDDEIFIWNWRTSTLLGKVDLARHVNSSTNLASVGVHGSDSPHPIAVTGLYSMRLPESGNSAQHEALIFVLLESYPAVIALRVSEHGALDSPHSYPLTGNPLDLTVVPGTGIVLVAVDPMHKPGSKETLRQAFDSPSDEGTEPAEQPPYIEALRLGETGISVEDLMAKDAATQHSSVQAAQTLNSWAYKQSPEMDASSLKDLFYGVEHMRKRVIADGEADDDEY